MHSSLPTDKIISADMCHLEDLVDFQVKLAFESEALELDKAVVRKGVRKVLESKDDSYYLLYLKKTKPVACLLIQKEWSDWRAKSVLWIHSVYVEKNERQKGIFKTMYQKLKSEVEKDPQLAGLRLFVDKKNLSAIKTYEALKMDSSHYTLFEWLT